MDMEGSKGDREMGEEWTCRAESGESDTHYWTVVPAEMVAGSGRQESPPKQAIPSRSAHNPIACLHDVIGPIGDWRTRICRPSQTD